MSLHATYFRLNLHALESDRAVVRAAHQIMRPGVRRSREHREARHKMIRALIDHHRRARDLYRSVAPASALFDLMTRH